MPRSQKLLVAAIACFAVVLPALCVSVPGLAATPPAGSGPSPAAKACGALPKFREAAATQIMAGKLKIAPFKTVTVDPHRDGDIDWSLDPFGNPTWYQDFRSATWVKQLIAGWAAGGPEAKAYRQRAREITSGWLRAISRGGRDPQTLVCIAQAFPGQAWIQNQIPPTVSYYAQHWQGPWNHGLVQDIKLLRIGCGYPAIGVRRRRAVLAKDRRIADDLDVRAELPRPRHRRPGGGQRAGDRLRRFVYHLWRDALPMLGACGYKLPSWVTERIAKLPAFLAYATQPDGNLVQIGDTYVERSTVAQKRRTARRGLRPRVRVRPVFLVEDRVVLLTAVRPGTAGPRP